jgi:hypothetical protein
MAKVREIAHCSGIAARAGDLCTGRKFHVTGSDKNHKKTTACLQCPTALVNLQSVITHAAVQAKNQVCAAIFEVD